jgi:hypothetical protein
MTFPETPGVRRGCTPFRVSRLASLRITSSPRETPSSRARPTRTTHELIIALS